MTRQTLKCKLCNKTMVGRSDKKFCSISCKNTYHSKLTEVTVRATGSIDRILHRNRSILLEIMGKKEVRKKIPRTTLDDKKFNYAYLTGYHINSRQKIIHYVYDFSWMIFSDSHILITRLKNY